MEVLSGGVGAGAGAGAGGGRDRGLPLPPPPGRRYFRRQSSLALSPSDMFLFRPPKPTYVASSWPGDLCVLGSSVCLALERVGGASKVLLFCHGTSSDLGMSRRSLEILRDGLRCHVIGVEYPGYGLTADGEPTEESINAAVRVAFLHLTEVMGWPADRVVVMGRSLGSGPAARLAREFQPGALFLLAPFTGVADIAGSIVGDTLASMFSLNQWDNKKEVAATVSPTLVLHGLKDQVVPHTHSLDLYRASAASKKYVGLLLESDHNRISWGVVCDMYARPFMEMVCPGQRNRALGIRQTDVAKLSNFDPSGRAALILACAEAVWARRRQEEYGSGGSGGGGGTAQGIPREAPTSTGQAGVTSAAACGSTIPSVPSSPLRGDGNRNELASGAAAAVSPSASPVFVGSSPAAARGDGGTQAADKAGEAAGETVTPAVGAGATAGAEGAGRTEKRIRGGENGKGWSFLSWTGEPRGEDSNNNGGGGGGGGGDGDGCGLGVGAGGWGSGTVRAPAFEGQAMGSIACGNRSNPRESTSGGVNSKSASACGIAEGAVNLGGAADCPRVSTNGGSSNQSGGVGGQAGGGVKLGGAAEYAVVLGKNGRNGGGGSGVAAATAESKGAGTERGWGKLSGLFSGR